MKQIPIRFRAGTPGVSELRRLCSESRIVGNEKIDRRTLRTLGEISDIIVSGLEDLNDGGIELAFLSGPSADLAGKAQQSYP